jgi:hypothetical protein
MSSPVQFIDNRQYHKSNYDGVMKYLLPSMYFEQDYALKDEKIDIIDQIINSNLKTIGIISSVLTVSAGLNSEFSAINKPVGISRFFIKQNNLTNISIQDFENKILIPLNYSFRNFTTSEAFSDFLLNTLLPGITVNTPSLQFVGTSVSANHDYLIKNLSWLYFLNFSNPNLSYNPSSFVYNTLINKTYRSEDVTLNDGIKGLTEYIWKNYSVCSIWRNNQILPIDFTPEQYLSTSNAFTSGTQQLDKLLTLMDVVYSPSYMDQGDVRVKTAIRDYLDNSFLLTTKSLQGPFLKLLKAFSFAFADYSNMVDRIEVLNDLDECPDEYIPMLAELIGWKLYGSDPVRWRLQLANAVDIYKTVGTKKSIQFVINSVLGPGVKDVSSSISECWESYVPFLIYYALATESPLLKDFSTWTPRLQHDLNVVGYSFSSMDENIRMCVDKIITDTVYQFKNNFILAGAPFNLNSLNFVFNYRGRDLKVPPFEEIPYYSKVIMNTQMIDYIEDRLLCFQVPIEFARKVSDYIKSRTLLADDDFSMRNSWLMFTSSMQFPPNWDDVIKDVTNSKSEYLPLWNGKSSHFKLILDISSFDFSKTTLEADSKVALTMIAQAVEDFTPAKSIGELIARASLSSSDYSMSNVHFQYINSNIKDTARLNVASNMFLGGYGSSALLMSTYKKGLNNNGVNLSRRNSDSISDPLMVPSGTIGLLPRKTHRRRNHKFLLPTEGFYNKSGFNMPSPFESYSGSFMPLGLIPSSQTYVPVTDHVNLPDIYNKCENLNSTKTYYGVAVSNTFPVRGWRGIESNAKITSKGVRPDYYLDYGQLDPLIATIHYINENAKLFQASSYYSTRQDELIASGIYDNLLINYVNNLTQFSGGFPNSIDDYYNFKLGREFHKLYYDYTHNFQRHRVTLGVLDLDGPTVFAHAYGSILMNSKLKDLGSFGSNVTTTSLENLIEININSNLTSGTFVASSTSSIPINYADYRNSGVLKYVELCQVSGSSPRNTFAILSIPKPSGPESRYNPLIHDNILIRQQSYDKLGRILFDIKKYQTDQNLGFDVSNNFLTPNHEYKLSFNSIICDEDGRNTGGGTFGVWIHTKEENGKVWSYCKDKCWKQHSVSDITSDLILSQYSNLYSHPFTARDLEVIRCSRFVTIDNPLRKSDVIASLSESEFITNELSFNTNNKDIILPSDYLNEVHRLDQNYIIEIFTLPTQNSKFSLMYKFNLIDLTLSKWAKPLVGVINNEDFRINLSKEQLLTIIRYLNNIANTYASRVAANTSSYYETSGGSRISYAESPDWSSPGTQTLNGSYIVSSITLKN